MSKRKGPAEPARAQVVPAFPPRAADATPVVFYFQIHQPYRLRNVSLFDIGRGQSWFDDDENERIARRVSERCYVPVTDILTRACERLGGQFRCSFSISGTALSQMERWAPEALEAFRRLMATGCAEVLCETSHHSLVSLDEGPEFERQIEAHAARIEEVFGERPTTFRNTELVISEAIAKRVEALGFEVLLGEGADHLLDWRSPRYVYRPRGVERLRLLLRDYVLSDDIAFRYSNREWDEWPLTSERFAEKLAQGRDGEHFIGLFMDYETFGEHQWEETGILDFLAELPERVLAHPRLCFATPREVARRHEPVAELDVPLPVSWADAERDLTAWLGNPMQTAAHDALLALGPAVLERGDPALVLDWRRLTTSDHFYYMCTKWFSDGDVHKYFSPYASPHDAFVSFMNVLEDLEQRLAEPPARGSRSKRKRKHESGGKQRRRAPPTSDRSHPT